MLFILHIFVRHTITLSCLFTIHIVSRNNCTQFLYEMIGNQFWNHLLAKCYEKIPIIQWKQLKLIFTSVGFGSDDAMFFYHTKWIGWKSFGIVQAENVWYFSIRMVKMSKSFLNCHLIRVWTPLAAMVCAFVCVPYPSYLILGFVHHLSLYWNQFNCSLFVLSVFRLVHVWLEMKSKLFLDFLTNKKAEGHFSVVRWFVFFLLFRHGFWLWATF